MEATCPSCKRCSANFRIPSGSMSGLAVTEYDQPKQNDCVFIVFGINPLTRIYFEINPLFFEESSDHFSSGC